MAIRTATPKLRRYTDLAVAIHVLQTRSLTIIDPEKWDDSNDRAALAEFKKRKELKSLLALCFADCNETYHHWKVFAPGTSGVCLEFKKDQLVPAFARVEGVQHRSVEYRNLNLIEKQPRWKVDDLPFLKRSPYKPESEYRVIYSSSEEEVKAKPIPIELGWIFSVRLSPWMPKALHSAIRTALRKIDGCQYLPVQSTSLIDSESWKRRIEEAV